MKGIFIYILTVVLMISACDYVDNTESDEPEEPSYSGYYQLDKNMTYSDCAYPAQFPNSGSVTVTGDQIDFLGFSGTWDENGLYAEGSETGTVIVTVNPLCTRDYTTTYNITFTDYNNFTGTIDIEFSAACGADYCVTSYDISGYR